MKYFILLLVLIWGAQIEFSHAQPLTTDFTHYIMADMSVNNVYVAPRDYSGGPSTRAAEIIVNYQGNWPTPAQAAFDYAISLWEEILTSSVPIVINAEFGSLPPGALGGAGPINIFDRNGVNFELDADTWYPVALANKLEEVDLDPSVADIQATFSNSFPFYFGIDGNCPNNLHDFVTVVLHEIGHGLGFISSPNANATQGIYGFLKDNRTWPVIFDRFIVDDNGVALTDFNVGQASNNLHSFLTSDDLSWLGEVSAELYAPSTFSRGSSISHLREATYNGTPHALMTPMLAQGEAIHDPGEFGVAILRDIGWDAELVTGIEDEINIHSFDLACYENPLCPNNDFWELIGNDPKLEYNLGETGDYAWVFTDEPPISPLAQADYKVELLHAGGRYLYETGQAMTNSTPYWSVTIDNLPTGYQWKRNTAGQVKGELVLTGTDINGYQNEDRIELKINIAPDDPVFEMNQTLAEENCDQVSLSFYAPGATSYVIMYRPKSQYYYSFWPVPPGQFSTVITGLQQDEDYEFYVIASNQWGSSTSEIITRLACDREIGEGFTISPNPTSGMTLFSISGELTLSELHIYKVDDETTNLHCVNQVTGQELEVNLSRMPRGTYAVEAKLSSGDIARGTFIKI